MESLYFLIPLSLLFIAAAVGIFFWAVKSGQYDDLEREGERILFDDDDIKQNSVEIGTSPANPPSTTNPSPKKPSTEIDNASD